MKVHIVCIIQFYHQTNKMFGNFKLVAHLIGNNILKKALSKCWICSCPQNHNSWFFYCWIGAFNMSFQNELDQRIHRFVKKNYSQMQNPLLWNKSFHLHHVSRIWQLLWVVIWKVMHRSWVFILEMPWSISITLLIWQCKHYKNLIICIFWHVRGKHFYTYSWRVGKIFKPTKDFKPIHKFKIPTIIRKYWVRFTTRNHGLFH